jgi:hypothetical protein
MSTIANKSKDATVACRWKRVFGKGRDAVYRATCGRPGCPGHLGDLAHRCRDEVTESSPHMDDRCQEVDSRPVLAQCFDWSLSPSRIPGPEVAVYRGFPDSGYRLAYGGRRARNRTRVGRRDGTPLWPVEEFGPPRWQDRRLVYGQHPHLPALIWCPISTCGTLNQVDWPEALPECAAFHVRRRKMGAVVAAIKELRDEIESNDRDTQLAALMRLREKFDEIGPL